MTIEMLSFQRQNLTGCEKGCIVYINTVIPLVCISAVIVVREGVC